jgi:hypothetical protein
MYPTNLDPPYSENSGVLTLTGVPPGTICRVQISRDPTDPDFRGSSYRLETRGAIQAGFGPPIRFLPAVKDDPGYLVRWDLNVGAVEPLELGFGAQATSTKIRLIDPSGIVRWEDSAPVVVAPPRIVNIPDAGNTPGQWRLEVMYSNNMLLVNKRSGDYRGVYLTWVTGGGTTEGGFLVSVTRDGGSTNLLPIYLTFTNNTTGRIFSGIITGSKVGDFDLPLEGFSGQFPSGSYVVTASAPAGQTYEVVPPSIEVDLWCHLDVPLAFDVSSLPHAGFVTGGGWIDSPAGAYRANPLLAGRATFGVNAKYLNGGDRLAGNTEFQVQLAGINFHSSEYSWLFVGGANSSLAVWNGVGTINGAGQYRFQFTAVDGGRDGTRIDKMRMRIRDETTGSVIYDTGTPLIPLTGGSIVVHAGP